MHSTILRTILATIIGVLPLVGKPTPGPFSKPLVLKSTLLPGWGEHSYQAPTRGYLFNGIEAVLWIFAGAAYTTAQNHENDLYYAASEYGHISNPQLQSDVFLERVSKYASMDEYNAQMLRNRQWDRLYSAEDGQYWEWESLEKQQEYFDIKTSRYVWRQRLTYTFGAIALNHLVSTMDVLYLKRRQTTLRIEPELDGEIMGMRLSLSF